MDKELESLLEANRNRPPMTEEEIEAQTRSWVAAESRMTDLDKLQGERVDVRELVDYSCGMSKLLSMILYPCNTEFKLPSDELVKEFREVKRSLVIYIFRFQVSNEYEYHQLSIAKCVLDTARAVDSFLREKEL